MLIAVKALIDHIENSKWKNIVIGYHIAAGGTEEWTYQHRFADGFYDYSERNRTAYIKWLEDKYKTTKELSTSWKKDIKSFSDIRFPSPVARTYSKDGFIRSPENEKLFWTFTISTTKPLQIQSTIFAGELKNIQIMNVLPAHFMVIRVLFHTTEKESTPYPKY